MVVSSFDQCVCVCEFELNTGNMLGVYFLMELTVKLRVSALNVIAFL